MLTEIVNFLNFIWEFLTSGIYQLLEDSVVYFGVKLTIWSIEFMAWSIEISWEIAQGVLTAYNVQAHLDNAWSLLPAEIANGLAFFRVPEAINNILTALTTKFVMRLIPGL